MRNNFGNLPEEILDKIFTFVYSDRVFYNIHQCELVCKNWKLPAQRFLYSNIILYDPQGIEALRVAMKDIPSSCCPGQFTQSLAYHGSCEVNGGNGTSWINLFIDTFPNLRHIFSDIQGFRYFLALLAAHRLGKLKYLESIGPCGKECVDLHNGCALMYSDTLTDLNIRENKKTNADSSLYERLHMFPKVRRLYVDTSVHNFFETAENATESLPSLKSMFFANLDTANTHQVATYKPVDISLVKPTADVVDLVIHSISFENDNFLTYLMTKYPSLKRIFINQNKDFVVYTTMLEKIKAAKNNFSVPVLSKFMAFFSKCQFYSMDLLYTTLYVDEVLESYWDLCNPDQLKFVSITYEQEAFWPASEEHPANYNSLSHVSMKMNLLSKGKAVVFTYELCNVTFPHLRVLEKSGKKLDRLAFTIGSKKLEHVLDGQEQTSIEIVNGKYFSHIVENCTKLKNLHVYNSRLVFLPFDQYSFVNTSITNLTLERIMISGDTLRQISIRLPALKSLELKYITCINEDVDKDIEKITPIYNSAIDMPLTSFRYMCIQNYLLSGVCGTKVPTKLLIKVTTEDFNKYYEYSMSDEIQFECNLSDDDSDDGYCEPIPGIKAFSRATSVLEKDYNGGLNNNGCANLHVKCKSLAYLVVSLEKIHPDFGCSILIKNNDIDNDITSKSDEELHAYFVKNS